MKLKPVTKEILETVLATQAYVHFEHTTLLNKDGSRLRARASGAMQTWKRRPECFRLPIKQGLCNYGEITENNMDEWEIVQ